MLRRVIFRFAGFDFKYLACPNIRKMSSITEVSAIKSFEGVQKIFSHDSKELNCKMRFSVYLPPQSESEKCPVVYWLSGLTCSETNFIEKSGAQRYAAENGLIIVACDTSPRNVNIPGDSDSWDFGVGAGFYINATQKPWSDNYRMYSYVTVELMDVVNKHFPVVPKAQSIMGHSMGGHGALICALKNPGLYKSVSAFAPISNPTKCPWGIKAFSGYLGPEECGEWSKWDATELVKNYSGPPLNMLIDQGSDDKFLKEKQLLPENLLDACKSKDIPVIFKNRNGYDHSYYYISTFIEEHIKHHKNHLLSL